MNIHVDENYGLIIVLPQEQFWKMAATQVHGLPVMASLGDENFPRSSDKSRGVSAQPGNFKSPYGISIVWYYSAAETEPCHEILAHFQQTGNTLPWTQNMQPAVISIFDEQKSGNDDQKLKGADPNHPVLNQWSFVQL